VPEKSALKNTPLTIAQTTASASCTMYAPATCHSTLPPWPHVETMDLCSCRWWG
jgi:hypothetical protein